MRQVPILLTRRIFHLSPPQFLLTKLNSLGTGEYDENS